MAVVGAETAGQRRWWDLGLIFLGGGVYVYGYVLSCLGVVEEGISQAISPFHSIGTRIIFLLFCKGSCARSARSCRPGLLAISRYFLTPKPFHRYIDRLLTVVDTVGWEISSR